jgi:isopenicillin N synthase-like dioxygenase
MLTNRQVSKDDILSAVDCLSTARILNKNRYLLHSYACLSHSILTVILNSLTSSLGLPPCTLADLHRLSTRGGDVVRFTVDQLDNTKCVAPMLAEHRDSGTLALRFDQLDGLQMRSRGQGAGWEYVRPLPEYAIVSVGDALATFTDGLLRSCLQRVVAPPGQQTGLLTCSVAYLMRPETQARMCNIELSEVIPELKGGASQGLRAGVWQYQRAMAVSAGEGLVN